MATATVEAPAGGSRRPGARVFSGHESFACRYGWLPKLYEALSDDPALFSSDERAILKLGLGRHMVKSIRFSGDAFGLTRHPVGPTRATAFTTRLPHPETAPARYPRTPAPPLP